MKTQIVRKLSLIFAPLLMGVVYFAINGCNGNVEISANECQIQLGLCLSDAQAQWETGDQVDGDTESLEDPSEDTRGIYRANLRTCWDHYKICIEPNDEDDLISSNEFTSEDRCVENQESCNAVEDCCCDTEDPRIERCRCDDTCMVDD